MIVAATYTYKPHFHDKKLMFTHELASTDPSVPVGSYVAHQKAFFQHEDGTIPAGIVIITIVSNSSWRVSCKTSDTVTLDDIASIWKPIQMKLL